MASRAKRTIQAIGSGLINSISSIIRFIREGKYTKEKFASFMRNILAEFTIGAVFGALSKDGIGCNYFQRATFIKGGHFVYKGKRYITSSLQMCKPVFRDFVKTIKFTFGGTLVSQTYSIIKTYF